MSWGRGKGSVLFTGKGLLSRKPPNPFSGRERRKRESFYFLLFIPTTSFRFSKPKLKICIILSLPEAYSLFNSDPGRPCQQHSQGIHKTSPWLFPQEAGYSGDTRLGFKSRLFLIITTCPGVDLTPELRPTTCRKIRGPISVAVYVMILGV